MLSQADQSKTEFLFPLQNISRSGMFLQLQHILIRLRLLVRSVNHLASLVVAKHYHWFSKEIRKKNHFNYTIMLVKTLQTRFSNRCQIFLLFRHSINSKIKSKLLVETFSCNGVSVFAGGKLSLTLRVSFLFESYTRTLKRTILLQLQVKFWVSDCTFCNCWKVTKRGMKKKRK